MFGFIAQIAINIYVLRSTLAKDHRGASRSDTRVAVAGTLLPFIGLLGIVPAFAFIYGLDASPLGYVAGVASAIVTSLASQGFFLAKMHRLGFGSGLYLTTKLWFVGAGVGLLAVIHPILPIVAIGGFIGYKVAQKRSANRFSEIADTL